MTFRDRPRELSEAAYHPVCLQLACSFFTKISKLGICFPITAEKSLIYLLKGHKRKRKYRVLSCDLPFKNSEVIKYSLSFPVGIYKSGQHVFQPAKLVLLEV